jgi:hypothetical protein
MIPAIAFSATPEDRAMENLFEEIERDTLETRGYTGRAALSERVLEAIDRAQASQD